MITDDDKKEATAAEPPKAEATATPAAPPSGEPAKTGADAKPAAKKPSAARKPAKAAAPQGIDFSKTSVEKLVETYNEMVLTAADLGMTATTVKSFADAKTGALACERLHAQIEKARAKGGSPNNQKESDVTKKAKKATRKAKSKSKAKKTAKGTGARGPRPKYGPKDKLVWIGKKNPFREGSGKHERVARLEKGSGQTYDAFVKKGGKRGTLSYCVRSRLVKVEAVA